MQTCRPTCRPFWKTKKTTFLVTLQILTFHRATQQNILLIRTMQTMRTMRTSIVQRTRNISAWCTNASRVSTRTKASSVVTHQANNNRFRLIINTLAQCSKSQTSCKFLANSKCLSYVYFQAVIHRRTEISTNQGRHRFLVIIATVGFPLKLFRRPPTPLETFWDSQLRLITSVQKIMARSTKISRASTFPPAKTSWKTLCTNLSRLH